MIRRGQFIQNFFSLFDELSVLEACLIIARTKNREDWPLIRLEPSTLKLEWEELTESYVRNPQKEKEMPYTHKEGFSIDKWKNRDAQESISDLLEDLSVYYTSDLPVDMDEYYGQEDYREDDFTFHPIV